jgi:signal peptidase I
MLFWSLLSYLFFSHWVFGLAEVEGVSMEPTLHDGGRFFINRFIYRFRDPRPGEIVALRFPGEKDLSVKRVIALPRDTVQIRDGKVRVNGMATAEPYLAPGTVTDGGGLGHNAYVVDEGCFFVLGDNRAWSADSRRFGGIKRSWIDGKVAPP